MKNPYRTLLAGTSILLLAGCDDGPSQRDMQGATTPPQPPSAVSDQTPQTSTSGAIPGHNPPLIESDQRVTTPAAD